MLKIFLFSCLSDKLEGECYALRKIYEKTVIRYVLVSRLCHSSDNLTFIIIPKVLVHKFQLSKIRNIEKRRYLLQPIALELFLSNGRTYLLAFEKNERQRALQRIVQYSPQESFKFPLIIKHYDVINIYKSFKI